MYNTVQINGDVKSTIVSLVNSWPSFILVSNFQIYNTGILFFYYYFLDLWGSTYLDGIQLKNKCGIEKILKRCVILKITWLRAHVIEGFVITFVTQLVKFALIGITRSFTSGDERPASTFLIHTQKKKRKSNMDWSLIVNKLW